MPISLKSAAGVGGFLRQERLILESGQFVAPFDAAYLVTAIGAGGSGARAPIGNGMAATGGAAGGLAQKPVRLKKGDVLTLVIGAGGAAQITSGQNGNAGGTTTVTGPGIALTANGGEGGKTQAAAVGTVAGAVGGAASGGELNVQGGGSGAATITAANNGYAATGGDSVGLYGVGYPSGAATTIGGNGAASGGAGVGGRSADTTAYAGVTGGSAVASASAPMAKAPSNLGIVDSAGLQTRLLEPGGSSGTYPGGGGHVGISGGFGGGGGGMGGSGQAAGAGGIGGGGKSYTDTTGSGAGGQGCVVIEWTQEIA